MDLIQVSATFVVPEDKANDFSTALSGWVDRLHILDHLLAHDWAYLGVWQEEWLADPPSVEDILRFSGSRIKEKFSREKNASPSLDKESSHVRSNIARKIHLAMSKRAKAVKKIPLDLRLSDGGGLAQKEQETSHVRSSDDLVLRVRVNEGVAPHVITRKYYPDPRCKTLCTMLNTDYCRLKCDQDRLEPLD